MPPPLPSSTPPPPPAQIPAKRKNPTLIIVVCVILVLGLFGGLGIVAAVLIPTVGKVREVARRTVDQSSLRQIAQAALIYAGQSDGKLPPAMLTADGRPSASQAATLPAVAAALARDGELDDAGIWLTALDHGRPVHAAGNAPAARVLDANREHLDPAFAAETALAWDFVTGLDVTQPPLTPVAWTRGLRPDGTWDARAGVYGSEGGYIAFLGGQVQFFTDLKASPLLRPDGTPTSNVLETLPARARIVGLGPGTLHGTIGQAR